MVILTVAVTAVALVSLLNLVLMIGVIRRLREHSELLSHSGRLTAPDMGLPPVGAVVDDFAVTTTAGERLSKDRLAGDTLIGFFSVGCDACDAMLPDFIRVAAAVPGGSSRVIAVIEGEPEDTADKVERLGAVSRVVTQLPGDQGLVAACRVHGFPSTCVVDAGGRITASAANPSALPLPAPTGH